MEKNLTDTGDTIRELIGKGETSEVEFKSARGGLPGSFWESYSAFANTNGGTIVLGVVEKNNRFFFDGLTEETIVRYKKNFWDCAHNKGKVNVCLPHESDVRIEQIDGSYILICEIPRASYELRPVYINNNPLGNTYRRNHEGDYVCTDVEVRRMFADAEHDRHPQDGRSICRNPILQKMFMMLGRAEKAGSGVDKIVSGWKSLGWPLPTVAEETRPDYVVLTLRLGKQDSPKHPKKTSQENNPRKRYKTFPRAGAEKSENPEILYRTQAFA